MVQRMPPFTYAGAERADFFATAFSPNADDESGKYRLIEKSDAFDLEEAKAVTDGFRSLLEDMDATSLLEYVDATVTDPDAVIIKYCGKNHVVQERRPDVQARAFEAFDDSIGYMLTLRKERAAAKNGPREVRPVILTEGDNWEDGRDGRPCSPFSLVPLKAAVRLVEEGFEHTTIIVVRKAEPLYSKAFVENWQTAFESIDPGRVFFVTVPDDPSVTWKWEKKSTLTFALAHRIYFIGTSMCDNHKYKTDGGGNFVLKDGEKVLTTGYAHLRAIQDGKMCVRGDMVLVDL